MNILTDYALAEKEAWDYFRDFRKLQGQIKIDTPDLIKIIGGKAPLENEVYLWDSRLKSK